MPGWGAKWGTVGDLPVGWGGREGRGGLGDQRPSPGEGRVIVTTADNGNSQGKQKRKKNKPCYCQVPVGAHDTQPTSHNHSAAGREIFNT